jgi:hypothetical protein
MARIASTSIVASEPAIMYSARRLLPGRIAAGDAAGGAADIVAVAAEAASPAVFRTLSSAVRKASAD